MSSDLPLSPDDVAEIVAILEGTPYERLDIRTSRFALKIAREGGGWNQDWDWSTAGEPATQEVAERAAPATRTEDDGPGIRAPLPGTFYRAPQPGAPPFVEVGDRVEPDTVVAIVETMKLMTPVHAGTTGTIEAILYDNASPVEAHSLLMRIKP